MDITFYLCTGLLVAALLAYRSTLPTVVLTCLYWLIVTLWALGTVEPFSFSSIHWVQRLNINFAYQIDGLSQLFTVLIGGIGILVFVYAWFYTEGAPYKRPKLFSLLQVFAVSMLGIVIADDMILLFLCWELTSITSYLLIQFDVTDKEANQAAFNSLFVSVMGGLILLVSFILLNSLTETWSISQAITARALTGSSQLTLVFGLLLCGVITKSAQFPFYFWLTGAMKAPTPVSAYLHSATMVNAGIYLLARFHPLFSSLDAWYPTLSTFGLLTMALASLLSLLQQDMKAILAYTTIFALGVMVYLLGGTNPLLIEAFGVFLLFHGIYKAGAFMLVGIMEKIHHSRQLDDLVGCARSNWPIAICSIVIFGAMAGIPPFFGFTVKELIYEGKLVSPSGSYFLMSISILSSMLIAAASFRCLWYFFKPLKQRSEPEQSNHAFKLIYICPALLTVLVILFSVFDQYTGLLIEPLLKTTLSTTETSYVSPNTSASFLLSLLTSMGGLVLCMIVLMIKIPRWTFFKQLELKGAFEWLFESFLLFGKYITAMTQGLTFLSQIRIFFVGMIVMLLPLLSIQLPSSVGNPGDFTITIMVVCCILMGASLSLLISHQFLYNLVSLGVIGLSASFFFIVNGAVDVAITQLLVEVLTVIILLIALKSVRATAITENQKHSTFNALIALFIGGIVTQLLFSLNGAAFNTDLQNFYIVNSLPFAYGKNVVNVILVDFRSLDTFGEALVIVSTAIASTFMLQRFSEVKRQ